MYVMVDWHAAVDMKPGSYVNMPVCAYSLRMSITSGPIVPLYTGRSTFGLPLLNDRVALVSASFMSDPSFECRSALNAYAGVAAIGGPRGGRVHPRAGGG